MTARRAVSVRPAVRRSPMDSFSVQLRGSSVVLRVRILLTSPVADPAVRYSHDVEPTLNLQRRSARSIGSNQGHPDRLAPSGDLPTACEAREFRRIGPGTAIPRVPASLTPHPARSHVLIARRPDDRCRKGATPRRWRKVRAPRENGAG
jgi:hypothetical protein